MGRKLFTSESVTEGHPDKVCDEISDAILHLALTRDPEARLGIETAVKTDDNGKGFVAIIGEIRTSATIRERECENIAFQTLRRIGYGDATLDIDPDPRRTTYHVVISKQSPDIQIGVDAGRGKYKKQGAGDQGMMFGFAEKCEGPDAQQLIVDADGIPTYMPPAIHFAHRLAERLTYVRKQGIVAGLRPDGKTQVTVAFENGVPKFIDTIVVSTQHNRGIDARQLEEAVIEQVIRATVPSDWLRDCTKFYVNPTGNFERGGPLGDSGVTGRKIIVDTYGGSGHHGGGAFSGKDPTKVDRSAAYMARYIAKNVVAAGLATKVEIQLAYAIGVDEPVSVNVETFGTATVDEEVIERLIFSNFPVTPQQLIQRLRLTDTSVIDYRKTAAYGHFGRNIFPWEKTDLAEVLHDGVRHWIAPRFDPAWSHRGTQDGQTPAEAQAAK